jgi:hypothetical protein
MIDVANIRENIPAKLRERRQWVLWLNEIRGGQQTKVPYQTTGKQAKSDSPDTWSDYESTTSIAEANGKYAGVGFMFSESDGLAGIDLDACRDPNTGQIADWAREIIQRLDSYSEVSPSQTGIKIFVRGKSPFLSGKNKTLEYDGIGDKKAGIEIYDKLRYFAVTGERLSEVSPNIEARDLWWLRERFWPEPAKQNGRPSSNGAKAQPSIIERARKYLATMPGAISGAGGHNDTFKAACALVLGFDLSEPDAMPIMLEYNQRCEPQWTEHELQHKVRSAAQQPGERGYLRDAPATGTKAKARKAVQPSDTAPAASLELDKAEQRTESANARRLVELYGDGLRWCEPWGKWLAFDGRRWRLDDTRQAAAWAKRTTAIYWKWLVRLF